MSTRKKPTVLIVEDVSMTAEAVSNLFIALDFQPVVCFNMEDAVRHAEEQPVGLAMIDIFMPGIGGIEGIRPLKEKCPGIRIIAMTAGRDDTPSEKTLKAAEMVGADAVMKKPVLRDDLEGVLDTLYG